MIAPPKPPSRDELEALIKEARARHLRRRLLGAAGLAITAALGLSVYALAIGGNAGNIAQDSARAGRASAPLCRASQLSLSVGGQGATQMTLGGAVLANTSSRACSLPTGRPFVRITWQGKPLTVREPVPVPGSIQSGAPAHVLAPRSKALISMEWGNWCGRNAYGNVPHAGPRTSAPKVPPTFQLRFRQGLALTGPGLGIPTCVDPGEPSFLYVSHPLVAS
jgi:uncharacterized protein DUF4232